MIATLAALVLLLGASAALGAGLRHAIPLPAGPGEDALALTAGLGATALLLSLLALGGAFAWALPIVALLALGGGAVAFARLRDRGGAVQARHLDVAFVAAAAVVLLAALSALAPVTDPDSLAYPLPLARRIAASGVWRFWPDLWLGVFPLSQEMLLAFALRLGADRLGAISALELVLCALLLDALARRAGLAGGARGAAVLVGLGCPLAAFLAPSGKEDILVATMTLAAAHALLSLEARGAAASAGLFAGFAAGAKYTGLPIAAGAVLAVLVFAPRDRARRTLACAASALAAGGLFYAVNVARFGNPVPPFLSPPLPTFLSPLSLERARHAFDWGAGRGLLDLVLAPVRMFTSPARFGTAGGLFNPLAWLGVLALTSRELRLRHGPLLVVAGVVYAAWFATDQVARLLLPAALLMSVPAADILARVVAMSRPMRLPLAAALALSAASALAVSGIRVGRWASDPRGFFARETTAFDELAWMNAHLDPRRHRVATTLKSCDALRVPWMNLEPAYQAEIPAELLGTGVPLLRALHSHGVTHVFVPTGSMPTLERFLLPVHANAGTRLGGVSLLHDDPSIPTTVYALPSDNARREGGR